ncbi:MAG: hypothetical protein HUU47_02445 [Bacteroidetes bacterium]|nr:hypothetical protein [Bacteroidota bacterium]
MAIVIIVSCTSKKERLEKEIFDLEISDSSSSPKGMNELADKYILYFKNFPKDTLSEKYLYKAFMFKYLTSHWNEALQLADEYKNTYSQTENLYNIYLKKARIYNENIKNADSATYYFMICDGKIKFSTHEYRQAAIALENWLKTSNINDSAKLANVSFTSAKYYQLCTDYEKSVKMYEETATRFTKYDKSPQALSTAAFVCWNELKQLQKAKEYYELLIKKYPESQAAKEAKVILKENLLQKTDEELAEYLLKKSNSGI